MDEPGLHARHKAQKQDKYNRIHQIGGLKEPAPLPDHHAPFFSGGWAHEAPSRPSSELPHGFHGSHQPQVGFPEPAQRPSFHENQSTSSGPPTQRSLNPHLQFMCGPMLRYDNVDLQSHSWLGFCCVVTADRGSLYEPSPMLQMRWTPHFPTPYGSPPLIDEQIIQQVNADRIYVYQGSSDSYSFWRFRLIIPMAERETSVHYSINHGAEITFHVPAINQNMRWAGTSCNGFSAGVDQARFNGSDPVWNDLLNRHKTHPFHVLVGGGDQLYCDPIAKEPELAGWLTEQDQNKKKAAQLTEAMALALDRFFFSHYCNCFRSGAFGKAISCIPMINMLDDHDIIDGFGSYPSDLQLSPVFSAIGSRGYFWYLLFQLFIVDSFDQIHPQSPNTSHLHSSLILGAPGPYIPFRNHSFICYLGPQVRMCLLDCRSERKKDQVCSPQTYQIIFDACRSLPVEVTHLIYLLGIPIVYPRMVFAEKLLEKRDHFIFKTINKLKLVPGFYNNFNADPELLDDMNDHWCAQSHKQERNWLICELQKIAVARKLRITFLSGDVHCGAVGRLFTQGGSLKPEHDPKYMLNVISSAIVNTPPPPALIGIMGKLSQVSHKSLKHVQTEEDMMDAFVLDTNGNKLKNPRFMARRNYCAVRFIDQTGELEFNVRVEIEQGLGETKGYPILVPSPNYQSS